MSNGRNYLFVALVNFLSLLVVSVALAYISYISLLQTISAFSAMADSSIMVMGYEIGSLMPYAFGIAIQYGQNVALFLRAYGYLSSVPLFRMFNRSVSAKDIALAVYFVSAFVDALTNIVWFNRHVTPTGDIVIDAMVFVVGYASMILVVFVEEVLGLVLQALRRSYNDLAGILRSEIRIRRASKKAGVEPPSEPLSNGDVSAKQRQAYQQQRQAQQRRQYGDPAYNAYTNVNVRDVVNEPHYEPIHGQDGPPY